MYVEYAKGEENIHLSLQFQIKSIHIFLKIIIKLKMYISI